jgi:WD40 repeat protein
MRRDTARAARLAAFSFILVGLVVGGDVRANPGSDDPILVFETDQQFIERVAATNDKIATGGGDMAVRLWSASDGKPLLKKLTTWYHGGHPFGDEFLWNKSMKTVRGLAFSPSREEIASASEDGNVRIWSTKTGKLLKRIRVHPFTETAVYDLAYSPGGDKIAVLVECFPAAAETPAIQVWSVEKGKRLLGIYGTPSNHLLDPHHPTNYRSVAFSPDGKRIVAGNEDGNALVYAVDGGAAELVLPVKDPVMTVAFSPSGAEIATRGHSGKIYFWSASDGKPLRTIDAGKAPNGASSAMVYSPCGDVIASAAGDTIKLWSTADGTLKRTLTAPIAVMSIAFTPAGDRLAAASRRWNGPHAPTTVRVWKVDPCTKPGPSTSGIAGTVGGP